MRRAALLTLLAALVAALPAHASPSVEGQVLLPSATPYTQLALYVQLGNSGMLGAVVQTAPNRQFSLVALEGISGQEDFDIYFFDRAELLDPDSDWGVPHWCNRFSGSGNHQGATCGTLALVVMSVGLQGRFRLTVD